MAKTRKTGAKASRVISKKKASARRVRPKSLQRLFKGIGTLYTLAPAAIKQGRHVQTSDLGRIERAAIVERGGRIVWAGPEADLPKEHRRAEESVDLKGATLIPALVECHTHLVYDGNRAGEFERRNQGESYQSIAKAGGGILATVLPTRAASEVRLAQIAQARVERFIRQGVTTIESKSGYGLTVEDEFKMLRASRRLKRARIVPTFLGAHAIPKEFASADAYIDTLVRDALPRLKKEKLAQRVDIFVEQNYFLGETARRYLKAAKDLGLDLVIHADQLTRSGGAELAVELGARSADHLIQIQDSDIAKLAASDVTSVLLPNADLYMKCAYPPARKLIEKGARVALATDMNPGTAPSQDVALAGVLARVEMKMSLAETLAAYTIGAAHALGLESDLGALTEGRLCDFCVLEGDVEELFLEVGRMPIAGVFREGVALL